MAFSCLGGSSGRSILRRPLQNVEAIWAWLILFFLPCVALIQPNGSLVELFSGSAAALVGAFVWNQVWKRFAKKIVDYPETDGSEERKPP